MCQRPIQQHLIGFISNIQGAYETYAWANPKRGQNYFPPRWRGGGFPIDADVVIDIVHTMKSLVANTSGAPLDVIAQSRSGDPLVWENGDRFIFAVGSGWDDSRGMLGQR